MPAEVLSTTIVGMRSFSDVHALWCEEPTIALTLVQPDVHGCRKVALAGHMTAWVPIDMPFDGRCSTIELVVPRHRRWCYRFWLDESSWINDPDADDYESRGEAGAVSVRYS